MSALTVFVGGAEAATSSTLNFQGRLLSNTGTLVADGQYNMQFDLYYSSGGTLWTEDRLVANSQGVTIKDGYFSVRLGEYDAFPGNINWDQELFLGLTVRGTTSCAWGSCIPNDNEMTPRFKLTAVPYAFRAGAIVDASGNAYTGDDLIQKSPSTIQAVSSALSALRLNQTGTGGLLQLQGDGSDVFTIDKSGNIVASGGVTLGNSTNNVAGTIRWNGTSFEGYNGTSWAPLGSGGLGNFGVHIVKTANETINNTNVFQNDDQLAFPLGANENWTFRFVVQANSGATPDLKFAVTAPVGATCAYGHEDPENAVATANLACGASTGLVTALGVADLYEVVGTVRNGANAGNVTLQWAQNTANASNTIVYAGSFVDAFRQVNPGTEGQPFVLGGNAFNTTATLGTNDSNNLELETNGSTRLTILSGGNVGVGDTTPAALFTVGSGDAFQVDNSGNVLTSGALQVTGNTTITGNLLGNGSATGTTGTTSGTGTNTTTLNLAADSFAVNDVVLIDNSGQDYYTRVTNDPGTGSYTVSPAITYENSRTVTKHVVQNIGASSTDYSSQSNRFFQGYFLGGVIVGSGSTTLSDGLLQRTDGDININPGTGGALQVNGTLNATTVNATNITGDGSGLTNIDGSTITGSTITGINASNIDSGTLTDNRLSTNVVLLDSLQTFSASKTFGLGLTITAGQNITLNGESINDLSGNGLSVSSGVLNVVYGSSANTAVEGNTSLTCASGSGNLSGGGDVITLGSGGTCSSISISDSPTFATSVTTPAITSSGALSISSASGASITLDSSSDIIVLGDSILRRAGDLSIEVNGATTRSLSIVNTDATNVVNLSVEGSVSASGFSGNGSGLTVLDATNISSGTVDDARLSSNVLVLGGSQTVTGTKTFNAGITVSSGQSITINGESVSDLTGTGLSISGGSLALDTTYLNSNYLRFAAGSIQADSSNNDVIAINKTSATGNLINIQRSGTGAFTVANSGALQIQSTSTSAIDIRNAGGTSFFTVDTSGNIVRVGSSTADATGVLFVLDTKNTAGDPTGVNGASYYNSNSNKFRCFENSTWKDCISQQVVLRKTANETITNDNTNSNDNTLFFNMSANTTYVIQCKIFFDTSATPDFKYATVGPATPTSVRTTRYHVVPGTSAYINAFDIAATASTSVTGTGTTGGYVTMETIWQNGANAGTWAFQWAQNTANIANTTVLSGSYCEYSTR